NAQACACGLPLARRAKFCPECGEPRAVTGAQARPGLLESEEPAAGKGGTVARDAGDADNGPAPDDGPLPRDEEDSPATRRVKNRGAQRVESQAAYRALKSDIVDSRRKALSTLTGLTSTAVVGL